MRYRGLCREALNNRKDGSDVINKEWMKGIIYPDKERGVTPYNAYREVS